MAEHRETGKKAKRTGELEQTVEIQRKKSLTKKRSKTIKKETQTRRKKQWIDKTVSLGNTEVSFTVKRMVKPKKKRKPKPTQESLFSSYVTMTFLIFIILMMGYAVYLDLNRGW